jgi:cytochrome c-type biogenesis protein CcmH/NrfG
MEYALTSPSRRILLLSAALLVAFVLLVAGGKMFLAERAAASEPPGGLVRALALEPENARYWHQQGLFYQYDFAQADLAKAIASFQRATELNPHDANFWLDLAAAYEVAGQTEAAREAFRRAQSVYPISADVGWKYGNFLLRQGELAAALAEIRRAVETDPRLARLAVRLVWRATGDAERLLAEALPPRRDSYLAALELFLGQGETEAALAAWQRLLALGQTVPLPPALPLVEALMRADRIRQAHEVWVQALAASGEDPEGTARRRLVWNGGFERTLVNGGFGWRVLPVPGAQTEPDTNVYRSAPRSLRIRFDGTTNVAFQHVSQFVAVEPGRRYRFEAYLRTEGISTDSGVRFWISDPRDLQRLDILTPNILGTQPWSLEEAEFTAGPQTTLVRITLRRDPSRKLDNKLRGQVWIDDVSLTPLEPVRRGPAP